jgi:MFS transporter, DHA2 family, multidrug resistance protein
MLTLAITSAAALIVFVIHELRASEPVVDLRVFKIRTYATGVFLMTLLGFVLYGSLVLLPVLLQTLLGYPSLQAGIAMAPRGMGSFIGMPIIGLLVAKMDPRKLVATGFLVGAITLLWLGQVNLQAGYWDFFWPQFVQGLSLALLFVPLTTITMDPIPRERMGNATSLFNLMRNIGGSIGIAITGTLLARHQQAHIHLLGAQVDPLNPAAQATLDRLRAAFVAAGADTVTATQRAYAALFGMVQRQASIVSFVEIFRLLGVVFLLMIPLVLLMKRPSGRSPMASH